MKKAVIVGAGQTGRGYLARLLYLSDQPYVLLDRDTDLVRRLREKGSYEIRFGGSGRGPIEMPVPEVYAMEEAGAAEALREADLIFTAVAEQNLPALIPYLKRAVAERTKKEPPALITCENGIAPKEKLAGAIAKERLILSEAVIFCTTLREAGESLDILSEDLDWLPYDVKALGFELPYYGMEAEEQFPQLLERKIYTYNCLSACVTYPGALLGYEDYAEAANDPAVARLLEEVSQSLNQCLSRRYGISEKEQADFSARAVRKFQNRSIRDTIERNARDVQRKLGPKERMIAPLLIMKEQGCSTTALEEVTAAAALYGERTGTLKLNGETVKNPAERLDELLPDLDGEMLERIREEYRKLKA